MSPQNKLALLAAVIQLQWGIELFSKFLMFATRKGLFTSSQERAFQEKLKKLAQEEAEEKLPEAITEQFNKLIDQVNAHIKKLSDPLKYSPFPSFSVAVEGHQHAAILDQLDMVERTLSEAAEADVIDWDREGEYFTEVLKIFSYVEKEKMQPIEGIAKLTKEIEKINKSLPADCILPLPILRAYE